MFSIRSNADREILLRFARQAKALSFSEDCGNRAKHALLATRLYSVVSNMFVLEDFDIASDGTVIRKRIGERNA